MHDDSRERWLPIPGYEGLYEVSNHGQVRSLDRMVKTRSGSCTLRRGRTLKPMLFNNGYLMVALKRTDEKKRQVGIHTLVLTTFTGDRPPDAVGCHNDGDAMNNRLENLRWDTQAGNIQDSVRQGTHRNTRKSSCDRGHLLAKPNLRSNRSSPHGRGTCLSCVRTRERKRSLIRAGLDVGSFNFQAVADAYYAEIMQARTNT